LGFEEEWPLTRWKRSGLRLPASAQSNEIRPHAPSDARGIESLDRAAFGVARPAILQSLLGGCCQALVHETFEGIAGYGAMREGSHSNHLGPLVAATARSGALLAQALLAGSGNETVYWDIPDPNVDAIDLAKSLGFAAERHWMRMFLGLNKHPGTVRQYFAIADPAVG
jgi:hypothetical protein